MILRGRGLLLCSGHCCGRQCVNTTSVCFLYLCDVRDFPERQDWVVLWLTEPWPWRKLIYATESKPGSVGVSDSNIISNTENLGTFHVHNSG